MPRACQQINKEQQRPSSPKVSVHMIIIHTVITFIYAKNTIQAHAHVHVHVLYGCTYEGRSKKLFLHMNYRSDDLY